MKKLVTTIIAVLMALFMITITNTANKILAVSLSDSIIMQLTETHTDTQTGKLTINGSGKLEAKAYDCYALDVRNGAELVVNSGDFIGNISAIYIIEGTATINSGSFSVIQPLINSATGHQRFTLNLFDENGLNGSAKFVVNGGLFENFDPSNNVAEGEGTNFVTAGCTVSQDGNYFVVSNN